MRKKGDVKVRSCSTQATKKRTVPREADKELTWVIRDYPQLEEWRSLGVEWLRGETRGISKRISAFVAFYERYLIRQKLPLDLTVFLSRKTILPDFYRTACPDSLSGVEYNNQIHNFLNFVLLQKFSESDDRSQLVISPAFRNPVSRMTKGGLPKRDESVYKPLPYGYIDELRQMIAMGKSFSDWQWAQKALGHKSGWSVGLSRDWYEVSKELIDFTDPDCVWRERRLKGRVRVEMWSPVRWVALLTKLILPLRNFQVRMLDSGEADTWRYANGEWTLNKAKISQGNERRPLQLGVFRRVVQAYSDDIAQSVLYINTNKTNDVTKSGSENGYLVPWPSGGPLHQDVFYWLEKLRNWQEKYNPITRRTAWRELDARLIHAKSEIQLSSYPDSCFLFRLPERGESEKGLPIANHSLEACWFSLLEAMQLRLERRGETCPNGQAIHFVPALENRNNRQRTLFPLHSLRVSLITALALEGQVPFPILQKLVGHSRLLMTLYYTKPGTTRIREEIHSAIERLERDKEASIHNFLLDTEHEEMMRLAICNSTSSLASHIPVHPATRNPAGWMLMHHGLCLVGGNTSEIEDNGAVGGCYNGGAMLYKPSSTGPSKYGPVPGGSRNCVRCRWFVTEPHYLPALVAHFNTIAYHFDEARNTCLSREHELESFKKVKLEAEEKGRPFIDINAYRQAERVWEGTLKRFSDLAEDLVACWRLIERCKVTLNSAQANSTKLVVSHTTSEAAIAFEETESELLQLSGVCDSVELYPDLEPGKAVLRRSQLLDAVLYRDDLPPVFMLLSEQEQLIAGNAFIRRLAQQMKPDNPALGQREVIQLMDAGVRLSQHFDMDLTSLQSQTDLAETLPVVKKTRLGDEK